MSRMIVFAVLAIATLALSGCAVVSTQLAWFADGQTFAGEVHNFTDAPILAHGIDVHWLDGGGKVVYTDETIGCLRSIPAGGSDFFEVRSPSGVESAGVTAEVSPLYGVGEPAESGLDVAGVQAKRNAGTLQITVTLHNSGAESLAAPRGCVVVRNAAGNVVRMVGLGFGLLLPGRDGRVTATRGVPYNGDLAVEVWADALLPRGVVAKPVHRAPDTLDAPGQLTGISSLDPILRAVGGGSPDAVRAYIGYGTYQCQAGVTPPGGDPCLPGESGQTIHVFHIGGCEGGLVRQDDISGILAQLADPTLQLYGVYRATAPQNADYTAVYTNALQFLGVPNSRYSASVHITGGRITALVYSCGTSDPAQLAKEAGAAVLPPVSAH